LYVLPF